MCVFAKYTTLKFITEPQSWYVNKFILTPFSPFGIDARNVLQKTFENVFLGHLGELCFHISPLDHGRRPLPELIEFLWIMLQYSIQPLSKI